MGSDKREQMPQPVQVSKLSLAAVLLAAGRSVRMGQPKMLLPWGKTSVLGHLIQQWQDLHAARIVVVCAAGDKGIQSELDRLEVPKKDRIYNPAPDQGMFSSIRCAAAWKGWASTGPLTHWTIALGDQPHLRQETLRSLLEFTARRPQKICLPRHNGHRRHPVFLPKLSWLQLAGSSAHDLRQFLDQHAQQIAICDLDDAGLDLDIDSPEDYRTALDLGNPSP